MTLDVPDGMTLQCRICHWQVPTVTGVGVIGHHFQDKHQTDKTSLSLVVLCHHCEEPMAFTHTGPDVDHYECGCGRTRAIRQES